MKEDKELVHCKAEKKKWARFDFFVEGGLHLAQYQKVRGGSREQRGEKDQKSIGKTKAERKKKTGSDEQ